MTLCKASADGISLVGVFIERDQADIGCLDAVTNALGKTQ